METSAEDTLKSLMGTSELKFVTITDAALGVAVILE